VSDANDQDFETLLSYLKASRGFDFGGYKRSTLGRRFQRRMQAVDVASYTDYRDYLEVHPEEFAFLFDMILINVTEFFRDRPAWEHLAEEVVPPLLAARRADEPIRAWSAGCASGEEAYTLAMVLAEALGADAFRDRVKIYGTDVDEDALARARHGAYAEKELASIPEALRERYFEPNGAIRVFRKDLRRSVIFGRHDLTSDAPISRLDLLVCRNTLMYFNVEAQASILRRFDFGLRDGGALFLGKAESLLTHSPRFTPIELKFRLFRKSGGRGGRTVPNLAEIPTGPTSGENGLLDAVFSSGPSPQLVIDHHGVLVGANERARQLFRLVGGDLHRPLRDLEVSYRPVELRSCIERAYAERRTVEVSDVRWNGPDGQAVALTFEIVPIFAADDRSPLGVAVNVEDVTSHRQLEEELQASTRQLETAYEELQSTNEELETTNEELQSTIEELETTNEELQSTNEELETMNEELQSTNEEMHTINEELRDRTIELNEVNDYLESILASMRAGVVVVDKDALVRLWNERSEDLWGLRSDEVRGKNFLNLDIGLPVGQLRQPIRGVVSGEPGTEVTLEAVNRRGRHLRCRVTISALGADGDVRGAILLAEPIEG
jgi:two-component system, chemotaxis family, CheB/CheR fusion protein